MFSSTKHRSTWIIASTSRILAKNWFPKPSPLLAPRTKPAISTNSSWVGITFADFVIFEIFPKRSSGTATRPTLGSIVQNGKFAASAPAEAVNALNSVDFPTFGNPTIPQLKPIIAFPYYILRFFRVTQWLWPWRIECQRYLAHKTTLFAIN